MSLVEEMNAPGQEALDKLRADRARQTSEMQKIAVQGLVERADAAGVVHGTDSHEVHAEAYRQVTGETPVITEDMQPPAEAK